MVFRPGFLRAPQPPVQPQIVVHHASRREAFARPIVSACPVEAGRLRGLLPPAARPPQGLTALPFGRPGRRGPPFPQPPRSPCPHHPPAAPQLLPSPPPQP